MQDTADHRGERDATPSRRPLSPAARGWLGQRERSSALALRFIVWVALKLGRPAARLLLYPICAYFLLFSSRARAASRNYLARVLDRRPTVADLFRHYHTFAATILDRVFFLNDRYRMFEVRMHGEEIVAPMLQRGEGAFLLGAHLGSFEVLRAFGRRQPGLRTCLVMYEGNARKVNAALHAINPDLALDVIGLGSVDSMLQVQARLARGDFVGMLGDRSIESEGAARRAFLGAEAAFPLGPFRMAAALKRPIILMVGLYRGGNRYDIHFERLADAPAAGVPRDALMREWLDRYVARLEHYCRLAPYNWFNFYDFWK